MLYLTMQGKLYTRDRLVKWGMTTKTMFLLCEAEDESSLNVLFLLLLGTKFLVGRVYTGRLGMARRNGLG